MYRLIKGMGWPDDVYHTTLTKSNTLWIKVCTRVCFTHYWSCVMFPQLTETRIVLNLLSIKSVTAQWAGDSICSGLSRNPSRLHKQTEKIHSLKMLPAESDYLQYWNFKATCIGLSMVLECRRKGIFCEREGGSKKAIMYLQWLWLTF